MFVGRHARNLDGKSRLAIPAEYVGRLAPDERAEMYITPGVGGCIWLVPKSHWEKEFEAMAAGWSSAVPGEFYHHCQLRPVDKAGRILLDEQVRQLAGIPDPARDGASAVMVCGSGRFLQVWDRATYEGRAATPRDFARALSAGGAVGAARPE